MRPAAPAGETAGARLVNKVKERLDVIDWRVAFVVFPLAVSVVITCAVLFSGYGRDPATMFGAVFASWIGGLTFFIVLGSVVFLVSLARPESENFEARARVLFGKQRGPHIDDIIKRLNTIFDYYAVKHVEHMIIKGFDNPELKFLTESRSSITLKSYFEDQSTTYRSEVKLVGVTTPPSNGAENELLYLRAKGDLIHGPKKIKDNVNLRFAVTVDPGATCDVDHAFGLCIMETEEPITMETVRFCLQFALIIENQSDQKVIIRVKNQLKALEDDNWDEHVFNLGDKREVLTATNVPAARKIYDYRIRRA